MKDGESREGESGGSLGPEADRLLRALQRRGATGLRGVRLRRNRSVLWSLTARGTLLNLHAGYRGAPDSLIDDLALLLTHRGGRSGTGVREAVRRVREWPPALEELRRIRSESGAPGEGAPGRRSRTESAVRPPQVVVDLFRDLNRDRFDPMLPDGIPIRISSRMRRRLGHMRPGVRPEGGRFVREIALNHRLLHPRALPLLRETLLHEMAHAADWILTGGRDHGPSWKHWARRVGCIPRACIPLASLRGNAP